MRTLAPLAVFAVVSPLAVLALAIPASPQAPPAADARARSAASGVARGSRESAALLASSPSLAAAPDAAAAPDYQAAPGDAGVVFYTTTTQLTLDTTTCTLPMSGSGPVERSAAPAQGRLDDRGSGELDPGAPRAAPTSVRARPAIERRDGWEGEGRRKGEGSGGGSLEVVGFDPETGEALVRESRWNVIPVGK